MLKLIETMYKLNTKLELATRKLCSALILEMRKQLVWLRPTETKSILSKTILSYPILSNPIQGLVVDSYLTDVYESSIDMLI